MLFKKGQIKNHHQHYCIGLSLLSLGMAGMQAGCNEDSPTISFSSEKGISEILDAVSTTVIYGTYVDLGQKADSLAFAIKNFKDHKTMDHLAAAKQAWRNARRPWEQSEAFIFGPVESKGIDPSIDSWPLNKADLEGVLTSGNTLNQSFVDNLEGTQKGFHTIEYLLFGQGNTKTLESFTVREFEYLNAVTASFQAATQQLIQAWSPTDGNYIANFKKAGLEGSVYISKNAALQELVNGMIGISDEVANGKINGPFTAEDRSLEESQFSDNSNADFQDNIRSIQNVYLGKYAAGTTNKGIREFVKALNPTLATRLENEIAAAITAIGEMIPTFGDAIAKNKEKVATAQIAIQKMQKTLEEDIKPLITQ